MSGRLIGIARRAEPGAPMEEIDSARVTQGIGIDGDYRGKARLRQITVLSREQWEETMAGLGADLPWTTRRANLLVEGVRLPQRKGAEIHVGELRLKVVWRTAPCSRMDKAYPGLMRALGPDWRGGVVCRVISEIPVSIAVGDTVAIEPDPMTANLP